MQNVNGMAKIALLLAALFGGSYVFVSNSDEISTALLAWKGAGVWLLAIFAFLSAKGTNGLLLTGAMAFGALGDVLIEQSLIFGAAAFMIGHIIAIILYLKNPRKALTISQKMLAGVVVALVPLIAWMLLHDAGVVLYALFLAAMAATAWLSRFPRYLTGVGAMLFVASDLLIFANMGPLDQADWANYLIWVLYFAGQLMIAIGVIQGLTRQGHATSLKM